MFVNRLTSFWLLALIALAMPAAVYAADTADTSLLAQGGTALQKGDWNKAIDLLKQASADPKSAVEAQKLMVVAALNTGKYDLAVASAKQAAAGSKADPKVHAVASYLLGRTEYIAYEHELSTWQQKHGGADESTLQDMMSRQVVNDRYGNQSVNVVDQDTAHEVDTKAGDSRDQTVKIKSFLLASKAAFQDALADAPDYPGAHDMLGAVETSLRQLPNAHKDLVAEFTQHGPSAQLYFHKAQLDFAEGKFGDGAADLRRAVGLDPRLGAAYQLFAVAAAEAKDKSGQQWGLGMAALSTGDYKAARASLDRGDSLNPDIIRGKAAVWLAQGRAENAEKELNKLLASTPSDTQALTLLGEIQTLNKKLDDAIATYKKVTAVEPANGAAWYGLGRAYDMNGDEASAIPALQNAVKYNTSNSSALITLARAQSQANHAADSVASLRAFHQLFPLMSNVYMIDTVIAQMDGRSV